MHVDTLTIRPDTAAAEGKPEGAMFLRRAGWLGAALAPLAAVLFASGLAVLMSLS